MTKSKKKALPPLIFIPTRGRTESQLTLSLIPTFYHKHVVLVAPAEDYKDLRSNYPTVTVVKQPKSVSTISHKRQWIMQKLWPKEFKEYSFAWMFDDDLYFSVFLPDLNLHRAVGNYEEQRDEFWKKGIRRLCRDYKVAGLGTKAFAPKGGVRENYHLGFAFGMHRSVVDEIEWNRIHFYEDIDYTLQFLRKGIRIGLTYDLVVQQRASAAKGGLEGERTDELVAKSLEQLISYHPDFVKTKQASGQHSMSNTRISWTKAAKEGGLK